MKKIFYLSKLIFLTFSFAAFLIFNIQCGGSESAQAPNPPPPPGQTPPPPSDLCQEDPTDLALDPCDRSDPNNIVCVFNFDKSKQGWETGFADYRDGEHERAEFRSPYLSLPLSPFISDPDKQSCSIKIEGKNPWDDLFMYLKRRISGLEPNQKYKVTFTVEIASNEPKGRISGGVNIYFKVGATQIEPNKDKIDEMGFWRMNIDKGNQKIGGVDMVMDGNMEVDKTEGELLCERGVCPFALITKNKEFTMDKTTNEKGELWAIIGTESANTTFLHETFYYNNIKMIFRKL